MSGWAIAGCVMLGLLVLFIVVQWLFIVVQWVRAYLRLGDAVLRWRRWTWPDQDEAR